MVACLQIKSHKSSIINRKSPEGFTLIELIVVFSVIAILSTIGIASFVTYSKYQTLQSAALELENTINLARSDALSQVMPDPSSQCTAPLSGYKITVVNATTYSISAVCGVTLPTQYTLPSPIVISTAQTNVESIFFPVLSGGVEVTAAPSGQPWVIVLENGTMTRTVTVDNTGNVY